MLPSPAALPPSPTRPPAHLPAGKTLLVEKLAAEAGLPLLALSPSAVLSKWAGESEGAIRAVFEGAAALSPSIIFIDECDALAPCRCALLLPLQRVVGGAGSGAGFEGGLRVRERGGVRAAACDTEVLNHLGRCSLTLTLFPLPPRRHPHLHTHTHTPPHTHTCSSSGDDQAARRVLTELLLQMNRVSAGPDGGGGRAVFVIAATNRPGDVDPALLRRCAGRAAVGWGRPWGPLPHGEMPGTGGGELGFFFGFLKSGTTAPPWRVGHLPPTLLLSPSRHSHSPLIIHLSVPPPTHT